MLQFIILNKTARDPHIDGEFILPSDLSPPLTVSFLLNSEGKLRLALRGPQHFGARNSGDQKDNLQDYLRTGVVCVWNCSNRGSFPGRTYWKSPNQLTTARSHQEGCRRTQGVGACRW